MSEEHKENQESGKNGPESSVTFDEDEDNNPFAHQGIGSLMSQQDKKNLDNISEVAHDDDESILLYNANSKSNHIQGMENAVQINFESRVSKLLKPNSNVKIVITEAGNSNEGMTNSLKKYVVYTIKVINVDDPNEEILTRRRYSDFESLREVLMKIFPLVIIPPIPPKNYSKLNVLNGFVGQGQNGSGTAINGASSTYSYINSTHLNKNKLIDHRKRLLTNFLNNSLEIPQIRLLEFFSKFLDPNANWSDEIALISSQLPKSIYSLNPENGLKTDEIYNNLPSPSNGHTMSFLKDNKKKFTKRTNKLLSNEPAPTETSQPVEPNPTKGSQYIINTSSIDEINKKIVENFIGLSNDYTELGTIFNSFSLVLADSAREGKGKTMNEDEPKLNIIFDKIGQVFDRSYITINSLIAEMETKFSEPLGEAVQYTTTLQFISKFQSRKTRQQQLVESDIKTKRKDLEELLKAEDEATRLDSAVNGQLSKQKKYNLESPNDALTTTKPSSTSKFKLFPSMNSLKKITQYVTDIIDQNPEQTRKQKISVLQTKIQTLEKCQKIILEDISYITDEIDKNFQLFHAKQLKLIYGILLSYNGYLIGWARKNVEIWEEVKEEITKL